jgi:hypothetical protein
MKNKISLRERKDGHGRLGRGRARGQYGAGAGATAGSGGSSSAQRQEKSSPEDRERKSREESLRLSKARIEEQLGRATNPAHRAVLERALKSLETESTSETLDVGQQLHRTPLP